MKTKPAPNWWTRNWKWLVPAGCLTGLAGLAGFIALITGLVFGLIKSSTPYKQALARAQQDPAVISRLGTPINGGFLVSGSVNVSGGSGQARLAIPLEGPRGSGTLHVEARRSAGLWTYSTLTVQPNGAGDPISLLRPSL
ncbi:hypothetical protein KBY97_11825 [Synechococcus sp. ATX 2A4]|uniref:cytochrome c oxidase assembly factor Coa1 family protein n=1 Tax=Synechococcus sp. ATX 2A4 TaxID=2823727 RepID=UPI0020CFAA2C|nr:cytochrome c oxidase assembly factor Coa1 family protein [Synechococcus sp. ATX 2A4]MCP9885805.1 hypothetical protein [Synechococcus sp. ATX 2A4]